MSTKAEREALVFKAVEDNSYESPLDRADWTLETRLDDAGLDSLSKIEVAMQVEEEIGIYLEEEDMRAAETIGDVLKLVEAAAND